jgi:hypothetical protein
LRVGPGSGTTVIAMKPNKTERCQLLLISYLSDVEKASLKMPEKITMMAPEARLRRNKTVRHNAF